MKLDYGIAAIQKSECELSYKIDESEKIEGEDDIEKLRSVAAGSIYTDISSISEFPDSRHCVD